MIDPCECGDVERCTLCRFRQTYMSAADAWQAGLAMAKECESLQSQLTQARAELERAKAGYQEWCAFLNDQLDRSDANKPKSLGRGEAYGVYFAMGSAEDLFGESLGVIRDDMCKEA